MSQGAITNSTVAITGCTPYGGPGTAHEALAAGNLSVYVGQDVIGATFNFEVGISSVTQPLPSTGTLTIGFYLGLSGAGGAHSDLLVRYYENGVQVGSGATYLNGSLSTSMTRYEINLTPSATFTNPTLRFTGTNTGGAAARVRVSATDLTYPDEVIQRLDFEANGLCNDEPTSDDAGYIYSSGGFLTRASGAPVKGAALQQQSGILTVSAS